MRSFSSQAPWREITVRHRFKASLPPASSEPPSRGTLPPPCSTRSTHFTPCARLRTSMRTAIPLLRKVVYLYTQFRGIVILRSSRDSSNTGAALSIRQTGAGVRSIWVLSDWKKCEVRELGEIGRNYASQLAPGGGPRVTRVYKERYRERARFSENGQRRGEGTEKYAVYGASSSEKISRR